jgi:sterol desaturase/sphingolipid hydroxylase (fatty acid hydroxylase superfamily)
MIATFATDFLRLCLWLLIVMMVFVPLERMFALRRQDVFRRGFLVDLSFYFLNNLLPKLILIVPMAMVGYAAHHLISPAFYTRVAALPIGLRMAGALVVGEVGFYWGHRWSHEVPFLWRFHSVHHSAEEMDWLVHTRAHPLDMVFTRLCGFIPIYVLGLAQPGSGAVDAVSIFVIFATTLWGFFIHANLKWRFGPLELLVTTPVFHHWHHTYDQPLNRNFSSMLPWMDRLFGTYYAPKAQWPARYGTEKMRPAGALPGTPVAPETGL